MSGRQQSGAGYITQRWVSTPTSVLTSRERIEECAQRPHDALLPPRVTHLVALALDDRGAHLASVGFGWAGQGCVGTCGDVKRYAGVYRGV